MYILTEISPRILWRNPLFHFCRIFSDAFPVLHDFLCTNHIRSYIRNYSRNSFWGISWKFSKDLFRKSSRDPSQICWRISSRISPVHSSDFSSYLFWNSSRYNIRNYFINVCAGIHPENIQNFFLGISKGNTRWDLKRFLRTTLQGLLSKFIEKFFKNTSSSFLENLLKKQILIMNS